MLCGLARLIMCVAEVPFFYLSGPLIRRVGVRGVIALTQLAYLTRFIYYSVGASATYVIHTMSVETHLLIAVELVVGRPLWTWCPCRGSSSVLEETSCVCTVVRIALGRLFENRGGCFLRRCCTASPLRPCGQPQPTTLTKSPQVPRKQVFFSL